MPSMPLGVQIISRSAGGHAVEQDREHPAVEPFQFLLLLWLG
jgi:hypothetical protein